jgi:hypothetical protein
VDATGEPVRVSVCHCLACQRRTGSVFGAQARFAAASVAISGEATTFNRTGDAGGTASFHFCALCGATVYYTVSALEGFVMIPVGAFADPSFPPPVFSVYEERMHDWVDMPTGIERIP